MREVKKISLVVPSYKQEKTILKNIKSLQRTLSALPCDYEIIIVIDGLVDRSKEVLKSVKSNRTKVLSYSKNLGKGYAIRYGSKFATGDIIGFIDAGMDIDPNGILMLLNHMHWYNADIIVGSKLHPVSQVDYPPFRKVLSWGYRTLTRILFGFKVRDTQVGLKLFRKKVVKDIFPKLLVKKFAFDIEILAVAYSMNYRRIYEAPIKLKFRGKSSIKGVKTFEFWKIISLMMWDTIAVFYRIRILKHYHKKK